MKNKKSIIIIVVISVLVASLHFIIPDYQGVFRNIVNSYLMDLLLPMNLYLLLQIAFRKKISIMKSRILGFLFTFVFGLTVEIMQLNEIDFLGSTYDPLDIFMYGVGAMLGLIIDLTIISRLENSIPVN